MKLRWLRSGAVSMRRHVDVIAADNPDAAVRVRRKIRTAVLRLVDFPLSGRIGEVQGTRELIVSNLPYIIVYRVNGDSLDILLVFHSSMVRDGIGIQ